MTSRPSLAAAGLKPGVKDPAERALAGAEADHRRVQTNGRLVIGCLALCFDAGERLSGPAEADPTRSSAENLRRPKASATFCWAMTGSIA